MEKVSILLGELEVEGAALRTQLAAVYGEDRAIQEDRITLMKAALRRYQQRFGDEAVRIFRSPGRINLRGMHVDTHGGYLNLMTHQREVILICSPSEGSDCTFLNLASDFSEASFSLDECRENPVFQQLWMDYINDPIVRQQVEQKGGDWLNYLKGSVFRAQYVTPEKPFRGLHGVVASDLPRGAALSSSHALCVVTLLATLALNQVSLGREEAVLAVRDAEWFTGARSGISDQAAEILGGRNELVNVALFAEDFDASSLRRLAFPEDLAVLVVNSYTRRSLSGAQRLAYTQNRFAYSMAMAILRQELTDAGYNAETVAQLDRLSRISPAALGGERALYQVLERIPAAMPIAEMRSRYDIPDFEKLYEQYFGGVEASQRPESLGLRGPLVFGVAESERARQFLAALEQGDYAYAGKLMTWGHNGDRCFTATGDPYSWRAEETEAGSLAAASGVYGASSRILDALVDRANAAGAFGSCLTGAGIAGAILVLCAQDKAAPISASLEAFLCSPDYLCCSGRSAPLTETELANAVVKNVAPAGAGELRVT